MESATPAATVAWITIAPVKALGLVSRDEVDLGPDGVAGDRQFCLVDDTDRLVGGKRLGVLVTIQPDYDPATGRLALTMPDGAIVDDVVEPGPPIEAKFSSGPRHGVLVTGPWTDALTAWAGAGLRLVRLDGTGEGHDRADLGGHATLVSVAALDALGEAAGSAGRVDGRRFRMLFGINGIAAHAEDAWIGRQVAVGEAIVAPGGRVGRCAVTTQDPDTGIPDLDTLRTIGRYRDGVVSDEPLPFGVWAEVVRPGRVRIGDVVAPA